MGLVLCFFCQRPTSGKENRILLRGLAGPRAAYFGDCCGDRLCRASAILNGFDVVRVQDLGLVPDTSTNPGQRRVQQGRK